MTSTSSQTLFAPNPPQLDDPWLQAALLILALFALSAAAFAGS